MSLTKNIGVGKVVFNPFLYVGDNWYEELVRYNLIPAKEDLGTRELHIEHSKSGKYLFLFVEGDGLTYNCIFDIENQFISVDNRLKKYLDRIQSYFSDAHFIDSFVYLQWRLSYKKRT